MNPKGLEGVSEGAQTLDSRDPLKHITRSRLFREYRESFGRVSGLPLVLRSLEIYEQALQETEGGSPFCAILAEDDAGCIACRDLQKKLAVKGQAKPATLRCFAGLSDSVVPVRSNGRTVAHLQTGQVLLHKPTSSEFSRTSRRLIEMGSQVDLGKLEEAYFQTRVLDKEQYRALLALLDTFARHLALLLDHRETGTDDEAQSPAVRDATRFIHQHQNERLSLQNVARHVNTSSHYFCRLFKRETGMNFTEYLARLRVEKAKHLLRNPHRRVSEVGYSVGFQSLSQFNRCFSRYAGCSPTHWRKQAP